MFSAKSNLRHSVDSSSTVPSYEVYEWLGEANSKLAKIKSAKASRNARYRAEHR